MQSSWEVRRARGGGREEQQCLPPLQLKEHTLVFLVGVEEEDALHEVLVEHPRVSDLE